VVWERFVEQAFSLLGEANKLKACTIYGFPGGVKQAKGLLIMQF
jgi:deoxyribose-phosphate aldolase